MSVSKSLFCLFFCFANKDPRGDLQEPYAAGRHTTMHLMPGLSCAGGNSGERQMIVGVRLQRAVNTPGRTAQVRYVCGNLCIWK